MFNVTNQYTFGAIFQRDMGSRGDLARRRQMVGDIILSYLQCEKSYGCKEGGDPDGAHMGEK